MGNNLMRKIYFRKSNYSKSKKSIIFLLILMALIFGFGRLGKLLEIKNVEAQEKTNKVEQLQKENVVLAVQAKEIRMVQLSEIQIKKLLGILIPKKKDQKRFMAILKCENGTYDPKRVNVNKPGLGYDLGIAQINSKFHSNRVKEFFGQEFDEAMQDPVKNLVYATYLYQNSGFEPWVCNKLTNK